MHVILDKSINMHIQTWRDQSYAIRNKSEKLEHTFKNNSKLRLYKAHSIYVVEYRLGNDFSKVQFFRYKGITDAKTKYNKMIAELGGYVL